MTSPRPCYAELHAHTNFSFLDGASHPEEMAAKGKELGLAALAVTDHDGVYGAVRFSRAVADANQPTNTMPAMKAIVGMELTLAGGSHLTLLARDRLRVVLALEPDLAVARRSLTQIEAQLAGH